MNTGKDLGLVPCGLGARDTLRLEAAMPLYGHEMTDEITPLETGLGTYVKMNKPDFIGKASLVRKGEPKITRVGLQMTGRGIAREHCEVFAGEKQVGTTSSGTFCPYLSQAVAMALVDKEVSELGTQVEVDVRGRRIAAKVVPLPFYKKAK
jgi:aminomethyltransferase